MTKKKKDDLPWVAGGPINDAQYSEKRAAPVDCCAETNVESVVEWADGIVKLEGTEMQASDRTLVIANAVLHANNEMTC